MSPRPSLIPDTGESQPIHSSHAEPLEKENESSTTAQTMDKNELNKTTANRAASCRVCLKSFKADDFSKTCFECKYRVCEDCASYSKIDSSEDLVIMSRHTLMAPWLNYHHLALAAPKIEYVAL
jgi:hypothetical protein